MAKLQSWYKTDLGFYATKKKLWEAARKSRIVRDMEGFKGRLSFQLVDFKDVTFQITSGGKLGVYYPESIGSEECLQRLDGLLVRVDGKQARIVETIREPLVGAPEKVAIVRVAIVSISVEIPKTTTFGIELSLLNNLKTSTIVEEISIKTNSKLIGNRIDGRIPAGETRKIPPIPCSSTVFGKAWKKGGKVKLKVIHTYGETSLCIKVPPLNRRRLPYTIFEAEEV